MVLITDPMDVLVQREFGHDSVGISTNDKIASTSIADDVEAQCRPLKGLGINADAPRKGDCSTLAAVQDPDDHLLLRRPRFLGPIRQLDNSGHYQTTTVSLRSAILKF